MYTTYSQLLEKGWTMNDIDTMDILAYWKIRAWELKKEKKEEHATRHTTIDKAWPGMRTR